MIKFSLNVYSFLVPIFVFIHLLPQASARPFVMFLVEVIPLFYNSLPVFFHGYPKRRVLSVTYGALSLGNHPQSPFVLLRLLVLVPSKYTYNHNVLSLPKR